MSRTPLRHLTSHALAAALLIGILGLALPGGVVPATAAGASPMVAARATPIEDYASYQAATRCSPRPRPGTRALARWMVKTLGGRVVRISGACGGSTSEHTEGRAVDWSANAATRAGRRQARVFLTEVFAEDKAGNTDAKARRMGIMYVIWDDEMYAAWNGFEPTPYLSSSCYSRKKCSKTLRHRDHVHVSLTRKAARGETSWYDGRVTAASRRAPRP